MGGSGVISERSDENLKTVRFLCPRQGQRHSRVADDAQVQYGYLLTNTHIGQTPYFFSLYLEFYVGLLFF
ncbi:hypothetical protein [Methanotorris igneus]|uniref:Uncharacterized protein n=1 Tax=Methanotorris igneus (strain DSM 5666 / JCM 11834 / Kol 5) TaxID=880724 RepID=F6BBK2_METIK|nr:hypothetical protein [Methanotorris igneus]AEF96011.1 hypothetical protein Metig_0455 [Methanotorris igneus Kol 5]